MVLLCLPGFERDTVDVDGIAAHIKRIRDDRNLRLLDEHNVAFDEKTHLILINDQKPRQS